MSNDTNKVVSLHGVPTAAVVQTELVEKLTVMLAAAQAGEIRAYAVIWLDGGQGFYSTFETGGAHLEMIGAVSTLHHDILHAGDV